MFHQTAMRIDDPSDNGGRGWRRLARDEVADLAYLAIRLASRGIRSDLAGRNAAKADEAARKLSEAVSARLAAYPTFGPIRAAIGHSAHCRSGADETG
jgi:hypothetical protein